MRKLSWYVSIILCLALLLGVGATGVFATEDQGAALVKGWSMTLNDEIVVNFTMNVADGTQVTVAVGDRDASAVVSESILRVPVMAHEITESITLTVDSASEEYTALDYCTAILDNVGYANEHQLVKDLLNYCRAAQLYFNSGSSDISESLVTGAGSQAVPTTSSGVTVFDQSDALKCTGAALVYRDKIALRFYFEGGLSDSRASVIDGDGNAVVNVAGGYVEVADILPQNLNKDVTITVWDTDNNTIDVTYSPMTYIVRMSQKGSDTTKALVKALYNYHLTAKSFVPADYCYVSFDLGYEGEAIQAMPVVVGGTYGALPNPTREGYTFEGWTLSDGTAVSGTETVTASHTLYAKWTANNVEVSFDLNYDGAPEAPATATVLEGSTYGTLPTPAEREGYTFGGWMLENGTPVSASTKVTASHTLYAIWSEYVEPVDPDIPVSVSGQMSAATWRYTAADGWHWYIADNGTNPVADNRQIMVTLPNDGMTMLSYEVKFNSLSGDAVARMGLMQGVNTYFDLETGALVGSGNGVTLETGKWYRVVYTTNNAANMGTSAWTFAFIGGFGTGNASLAIRNVAASAAPAIKLTTSSSMGQPSWQYSPEDGWHWYVPDNGATPVADNRRAMVTLPVDGMRYLTYEIKFHSLNNTSATMGLMEGVNKYYDLETGEEVTSRVVGKWYRVEYATNNAKNMGTSAWIFGFVGGFNQGNASFSIRNMEARGLPKYEVSFNLNYAGAENGPAAIEVEQGAAYGELPTPAEREHFTFDGWALSDGTIVTADTVVTASHTLYAKWTVDISGLNYSFAGDYSNYYISIGALEYEGDLAFKISNVGKPVENDNNNITYRRLKLTIPNTSGQMISMKIKIDYLVNTDGSASSVKTFTVRGNEVVLPVTFADENGVAVNNEDLQLGQWYTMSFIANGASLYDIRSFDNKIYNTFYIKDVQVSESSLTATASVAGITTAVVDGETVFKYTNNGKTLTGDQYARRMVLSAPTHNSGALIAMQIKLESIKNSDGTDASVRTLAVYSNNGTSKKITATFLDANGAVVDNAKLQLGQWYTMMFIGDGSAKYGIWTFSGTVNSTFYVKDIQAYEYANDIFSIPHNGYYATVGGAVQDGEIVHMYSNLGKTIERDGNQLAYRKLLMKVAGAGTGKTISVKIKIGYLSDPSVKTISVVGGGATVPVSFTDENGNSVNNADLQLGQWYTMTFVSNGVETYDILNFAELGYVVFYLKDITLS